MNINMSDKYMTRSGLPVTVLTVNRNHPQYPVVALVHRPDEDGHEAYTATGNYSNIGASTDWDLVPYVEPKVKVPDMAKGDDVVVSSKDTPNVWLRRVYSHTDSDGQYMCFHSGLNEWTSEGIVTPWHFIRKPTKEESSS